MSTAITSPDFSNLPLKSSRSSPSRSAAPAEVQPPNPTHPNANAATNLMRPTTTTTTPPAAAAAAGANKRQRKVALPLGDLTNLLPSTPAPRKPCARRPLPPPSDASACSSAASSTPVSKASSAAVLEELSLVKSPISTVYTSRRTQRTRKHTSVKASFPAGTAASCPPLEKATRKTSVTRDTWPISSSAPCQQAKKKRYTGMENSSSGKPKLPEDFVEKQRAYFQEIDAFELQEEEASETD